MTQSNGGVKEIHKFDISPFRVGNVVSISDYSNNQLLGIITGCEVFESGTHLYSLRKFDTAQLNSTRVKVGISISDNPDKNFIRWHLDIANFSYLLYTKVEGLAYRIENITSNIFISISHANNIEVELSRAYWWDDDKAETDHHASSDRPIRQTYTELTSSQKAIGNTDREAGGR